MNLRLLHARSVLGPAAAVLAAALLAGCGSSSSDDGGGDGGRGNGGGGPTATVVLRPADPTASNAAAGLKAAAEVLRKRLEFAGVPDADVRTDAASVIVRVPATYQDGLADLARPGALEFRPVLAADEESVLAPTAPASPTSAPSPSVSPTAPATTPPATTAAAPPAGTTPAPFDMTGNNGEQPPPDAKASGYPGVTPELLAMFEALDCTTPRPAGPAPGSADRIAIACEEEPQDGTIERYLLAPSKLDGTTVTEAEAQMSQGPGGWEIALRFNAAGSAAFTTVTADLAKGAYPTQRFAVTVDGVVLIAPAVHQSLTGGNAVITGHFTKAEAVRIAAVLRAGRLPLALTPDPVVVDAK